MAVAVRPVSCALVALALGLTGSILVLSSSAEARPLSDKAAVCQGTTGYPFSPAATIEVSATAPTAGSSIEVSGAHYCPDEDVSLTIGGTGVGSGHTDASGRFDPAVTVPSRSGAVQLCGSGETQVSANSDCLTLSVQSAAAVGKNSFSSGGTASTGVRVALIAAVALLLIAGGVAFATAGRRGPSPVSG